MDNKGNLIVGKDEEGLPLLAKWLKYDLKTICNQWETLVKTLPCQCFHADEKYDQLIRMNF